MSPVPTDFSSNAFWQRLALRLEPILGDIETKLGDSWVDQFESCFSIADFETFDCAREKRGPAAYVLTLLEPADPTRDFDELQAAQSEATAVALLLDVCKKADLWPTRVEQDVDGLVFWRDSDRFARVHRIPPSPSLPPAVRQRAQSLLGGLRKHNDVAGEFHRRMARWPGLAGLLPEERRRGEHVHWPCPAEWLISARRLWQLCGTADPTTAQTQTLAAAVFGVESWNQLCAAMPKDATDADWWAQLGPFLVTAYGMEDDTPLVHADPLAAFADFAGRAQLACGGPERLTCRISEGFVSHMPYLTIESAQRADESALEFLQRESPNLTFGSLMRERVSNESVACVQGPLAARDWATLLACFRLEPEDDVWPNRIFHKVQLNDFRCDGVVTAGGPHVIVGDYGAPVGACALRKFPSDESGINGKIMAAGWWLVKYEGEPRVDLTKLSDTEASQLASVFGLPLIAERSATLPNAVYLYSPSAAAKAFYSSPAWVSLRQWCRAHPSLANTVEQTSDYLPNWYSKAMLE